MHPVAPAGSSSPSSSPRVLVGLEAKADRHRRAAGAGIPGQRFQRRPDAVGSALQLKSGSPGQPSEPMGTGLRRGRGRPEHPRAAGRGSQRRRHRQVGIVSRRPVVSAAAEPELHRLGEGEGRDREREAAVFAASRRHRVDRRRPVEEGRIGLPCGPGPSPGRPGSSGEHSIVASASSEQRGTEYM